MVQRVRSASLSFAVLVCVAGLATSVATVACAVGAESDPNAYTLANAPIDSGADDPSTSVSLPPPSTKPTENDAGSDGGKDPGKDAGADSGPPQGVSCASNLTCGSPKNAGTVSGDTSSSAVTVTGSGEDWVAISVTEDDSNLFGNSLEVRGTLQSPAGSDFDLELWADGCGQPTSTSKSTGIEAAGAEWGEDPATFANGIPDAKTVTFHVFPKAGPSATTCDAAKKWTLTVNGNQH